MKNRLLKTALGLSVFILLMLGSSHSAKAATMYTGNVTSGVNGLVTTGNGADTRIYVGPYVTQGYTWASTSPLTLSGTASSTLTSLVIHQAGSGKTSCTAQGFSCGFLQTYQQMAIYYAENYSDFINEDGSFGGCGNSGTTAGSDHTGASIPFDPDGAYDTTVTYNYVGCAFNTALDKIYEITIIGSFSPWAYWFDNSTMSIYDQNGAVSNSFTTPPPTSWIPYYQSETLSGTCVHNGTDELALTIGRAGGSIDNVTSPAGSPIYNGTFNIDCVSNTWTASIGSGSDGVVVLLVDKNDYNNISNWVYGPQFDSTGEPPNEIQWDPIFERLAETNDFNNWLVEAGIGATSSPDQYETVIDYATEDYSTTTAFTWQDIGPLMSASQVNNSFSGISIPKTIPLPEGNYKARAYLDDFTASTTIAESDFIHFSVVYSTSTSPATDYPNSQTPASQAVSQSGVGSFSPNCNEGNAVVNGLCTVLAYLLMPKESDLTQFQGLFTGIENKPPFGYFTSSEEAIASLATSTPAASLGALSLLSIFFSPLRIGFTLLIFFLAGLWLFNRLRHFNFH